VHPATELRDEREQRRESKKKSDALHGSLAYRGVARAATAANTLRWARLMRSFAFLVSLVSLVSPLLALALLAGCTPQAPDRLPPQAEGAAPAAPGSRGSSASSASGAGATSDAGAAASDAGAAGAASGGAASSGAGAALDAGASVVASDAGGAASPVRVKVVTIGMHVGGGPYDEPTKQPMKRSVEPRFADLALCWRYVAKAEPTDVGVDLVIEAAGGRAKVGNPRTSATGEGFVPCVVAFFESVDFQKPNNGKTVVSYSVRFSPLKP
jgi:hypothetical protein